MHKYTFYLLCLLITSCSRNASYQEKFEYIQANKEIIFRQSIVDSCKKITLDSIWSSYIGKLSLYGDKLYFADAKLGKVYVFNHNGKFISSNLGIGRSNKEIDGPITGYIMLNDSVNCIISSTRCVLYDSLFVRQKSTTLNRDNGKGLNAFNPSIYTMCYENFIVKSYKDKIYYNMTLQYPKYNFIEDKSYFYNNARPIFVANYNTDEFVTMIGKYPKCYLSGKHNQFSLVNFDISDKGYLYLSYEAENRIYIYDDNYNPTLCFGLDGEDMDTNYGYLTSIEEFRKNYYKHRNKYSYYRDIKYVNGLNYICRIYNKKESKHDGLQIYDSKGTLLADLLIPKGYKIAGSDLYSLYLYYVDESDLKISVYIIDLHCKSNSQFI